MASKEFILQGFTARTHGDAIRELFEVADIQRVVLSVAFISDSGVHQIEPRLKPYAKVLTAYGGIRNDISSHQGLVRLFGLGGTLYAVDTGARSVVFHPKLYLVRGAKVARLVIGSANLTLGGLNNNIEAGLLIEFDLSDVDDKKVVAAIEKELDVLPAEYPDHILKVTKSSQLDEWLAAGRLVDEMALPPPRPSSRGSGTGAGDSVPRIKLKVQPLRRPLRKAKAAGKKQPGAKLAKAPAPIAPGVDLELVWESTPLTRRDLNIPDGANTNKTGSINLDKGLLPEDVDHRHYFRDDVFTALAWSARTAAVDEAYAKFQLVLKGISYGEFDLAIRHTTSTTSRTYLQHNAMFRLSWGATAAYVAHDDLIGRTLALYRDNADPTKFVLEID
ncbi:hypothetical protein VW23_021750 [Devosia insulae DS-56]|uniref:Phospholipase D-like domain-containing protein n=1 Tax=Devosia insulae DS-56 TaxID=1116389 RepID=A0A1E5XP08_9HYPH|nr:phospholipase D family protein [Devosia insulae]OEO30346.1 hypothetical protein VW23_021750 [Devosia insulae DS-56]